MKACDTDPLHLFGVIGCGERFDLSLLHVVMHWDISSYVEKPLHTAGLLQAAHQHSLQDVCGCACEDPCSVVVLKSASQATSLSSLNFLTSCFSNEDK